MIIWPFQENQFAPFRGPLIASLLIEGLLLLKDRKTGLQKILGPCTGYSLALVLQNTDM